MLLQIVYMCIQAGRCLQIRLAYEHALILKHSVDYDHIFIQIKCSILTGRAVRV